MSNKIMKRRIMDFISGYSRTHGTMPSYRGIGAAVGLRSPTSVSRYVKQLIDEGKLVSTHQKGKTYALASGMGLNVAGETPRRIRLEVADGGSVSFDCCMENEGRVTFTGIVDASAMKSKVGQVVGCQIDDCG